MTRSATTVLVLGLAAMGYALYRDHREDLSRRAEEQKRARLVEVCRQQWKALGEALATSSLRPEEKDQRRIRIQFGLAGCDELNPHPSSVP